MATKKNSSSSSSSSSTTTSAPKRSGFSYVMSILSYVAVCVGGVALFVAFILGKCGMSASFLGVLQAIANAIGWAVLCVMSFNYIRRRRKIWMWVVWVIAVVMIVIGIIFAI